MSTTKILELIDREIASVARVAEASESGGDNAAAFAKYATMGSLNRIRANVVEENRRIAASRPKPSAKAVPVPHAASKK